MGWSNVVVLDLLEHVGYYVFARHAKLAAVRLSSCSCLGRVLGRLYVSYDILTCMGERSLRSTDFRNFVAEVLNRRQVCLSVMSYSLRLWCSGIDC